MPGRSLKNSVLYRIHFASLFIDSDSRDVSSILNTAPLSEFLPVYRHRKRSVLLFAGMFGNLVKMVKIVWIMYKAYNIRPVFL